MAGLANLVDRQQIERFLRQDAGLHIYEIGDLDPFFWPDTTWYAWRDASSEVLALALLYGGGGLPVLLALAHEERVLALRDLVSALLPRLPARVYAHLSAGLVDLFRPPWEVAHHGLHLKMKMTWKDQDAMATVAGDDVEHLGAADLASLEALYAQAYPGNWFDARMLTTGQYMGIRREGAIVAAGGVHVYSTRYRVAALGNIATLPHFRGRGLARRVVAGLCRSLRTQGIETLGLNVKADNVAAVRCYEKIGFVDIARYDEYMLCLSSRPMT